MKDRSILEDQTTLSLFLVNGFEVLLRQSRPVHTVVRNGVGHIADADASPSKTPSQLHVLRRPSCAGAESFVEETDAVQRLALRGKVGAVEGMDPLDGVIEVQLRDSPETLDQS